MARDKKIEVGAINITTHPHSPEKYIELFRMAFRQRKPAKISGDNYGLIAQLSRLSNKQGAGGALSGDFIKFTNIFLDEDWWNMETNDFASDEEIEALEIPENMKPNSARFSFIFYPDKHLLTYEGYYEGKNLGASNAVRLVRNLFSTEEIADKFGRVNVTHIPVSEKFEEAFAIPYKHSIELVFTRPNADHTDKIGRKVKERLENMNVEQQEENYRGVRGLSIEPDQDLKDLAKVASRNGSVSVKGKDINEKPVSFSTDKHPLRERVYYDPNIESPYELLIRVSQMIKDELNK
jgi:hypothetical protein